MGIGNKAVGLTKLTAMICLSDYQTAASQYAKQLMNQTHLSISRLTLLGLSFLDIFVNHGIVLQKMRVRTMTLTPVRKEVPVNS